MFCLRFCAGLLLLLLGAEGASAQPDQAQPAMGRLEAVRQPAMVEAKAREIVVELSERYDGLRSYSDKTVLEVQDQGLLGAEQAAKMGVTVELAWERPDRIRMEGTSVVGKFLVTSDGRTISAQVGDKPGTYAQRNSNAWAQREASQEVGGLSLYSNFLFFERGNWQLQFLQSPHLLSLTAGEDTEVEGVRCHCVTVKKDATGEDGGNTNVTLSVGVEDGLLHRLIVDVGTGDNRAQMVETHSDIRLDPDLDATTWQFAPNRGDQHVETFLRYDPHLNEPKVKVGDVAPSFTGQTVDGKTVSLEKLRGQVVLLYFCHAQSLDGLAGFTEFARKYKEQDLRVVGIAQTNKRLAPPTNLVEETLGFPVVLDYLDLDTHRDIASLYGNKFFGWTYLIDRQGKLVRIGRDLYDQTISGDLERTLQAPR